MFNSLQTLKTTFATIFAFFPWNLISLGNDLLYYSIHNTKQNKATDEWCNLWYVSKWILIQSVSEMKRARSQCHAWLNYLIWSCLFFLFIHNLIYHTWTESFDERKTFLCFIPACKTIHFFLSFFWMPNIINENNFHRKIALTFPIECCLSILYSGTPSLLFLLPRFL